ncbi:MAG: multicopper oxidase family protein [Myxococcota bacterium]|nr:multicopper oxidase family protein [Myxococcota bacterium]
MIIDRTLSLWPLVIALAACSPASPAPPSGWDVAAPIARATDVSATAGIVELELIAAPARWTIAPGRSLDGYAYNGSVPGPLIDARAGDTLVVHFRNELPEPTTIHWHGVRLPADMDGGPHSQPPVPPGGTFEYRFVLPDAGTFWYHPHVDEGTQMERGLYGAIVVRPRAGDAEDEPIVDTEAVLVLDDLMLDERGELAPFGGLIEEHGGREGSVQLVNGTITPAVTARAGERQRWRIVNAGSARFYRLTLGGRAFTILGTDEGRASAPTTATELFLVPGDRIDVLVDLTAAPGTSIALTNEPYDRGHGSGVFFSQAVATLVLDGHPALELRPAFTWSREIERLRDEGALVRQIVFDESVDAATETVTFTINGESFPDVTAIESRVGAIEVWDLVNDSEMDHPFHLHGFFFQVLSRDGVPVERPSWEDTVSLRGLERARIAFEIDDRPGMWMFHCHILEHGEHGMMGMLEVAP